MDKQAFLSQALVLTDDSKIRSQLSAALFENGLEVFSADGLEEGLRFAASMPGGLILIDLDTDWLTSDSPGNGLLDPFSNRPVVVLASEKSIPRLFAAVESGVSAYLKKPLIGGEVRVVLAHMRRLWKAATSSHEELCGASPQIQSIRRLVEQAAATDAHVSVHGEPGVGKRVVGRMIHGSSHRRGAPFVRLSCAGLKQDVLESLLFGSGFTGGRGGCLAECAHGTLLIDDVNLLPHDLQDRLFRQLQEPPEAAERARIIAVSDGAVSDSSAAARGSNEFHAGLFGLLGQITIEVPPLRERKSDIPILADHFARSFATASGKLPGGIDSAALGDLMRYDWPGNVRELKDFLEHAVRSSSGGVLGSRDLPALPESVSDPGSGPRIPGATIDEIEKDAILRTLEATAGSTSKAARILGMSVRKIQYKLKEYRTEMTAIAAIERMPSVSRPRSPARKNPLVSREGR